MGRMIGPKPLYSIQACLFSGSGLVRKTVTPMARLEKVRTLLTSYSPPIPELFLNRGVKAQLGQFLSPMDERGIASDMIYYQPLLIGEREPIRRGEVLFSAPSLAVGVQPPIPARETGKKRRVGLFSLISPLQSLDWALSPDTEREAHASSTREEV